MCILLGILKLVFVVSDRHAGQSAQALEPDDRAHIQPLVSSQESCSGVHQGSPGFLMHMNPLKLWLCWSALSWTSGVPRHSSAAVHAMNCTPQWSSVRRRGACGASIQYGVAASHSSAVLTDDCHMRLWACCQCLRSWLAVQHLVLYGTTLVWQPCARVCLGYLKSINWLQVVGLLSGLQVAHYVWRPLAWSVTHCVLRIVDTRTGSATQVSGRCTRCCGTWLQFSRLWLGDSCNNHTQRLVGLHYAKRTHFERSGGVA